MRLSILALAASLAVGGLAHAGSKEVQYGPVPSWVTPEPGPTSGVAPEGAPARIVYFDWQTRIAVGVREVYTAYRIKLLKPEALAVGNLTAVWNPATDDLTVHSVKIIRDGREIDVLAQNKFLVVEREDKLEYAMLNGALTAALQVPGLQIGDELEFAATLRQRDPQFDGKAGGGTQFPVVGSPGSFRARVLWPKSVGLRWQASSDLPPPETQSRGDEQELTEELVDPSSSVMTDGAPPRFNVRRLLEYSQFATWGEISNLYWPLFERASELTPASPLHGEAAKIAAAAPTEIARAEAALRLVQDQVRYVYVGLDGGAYRPASADDTWSRRFGDCKAKTALLMALLRELGIESEPVLVNTDGGDGLDQRLPTLSVFNHVLVRAHIDGKDYWLDGTRLGDRRLATLPTPSSRWGLVLKSGAAQLEAIAPQPATLPQVEVLLQVDSSAGFDVPAKVRTEEVLRGDNVFSLRSDLAARSPDDAERVLKAFFQQEDPWVEAESASWRYDELHGSLVLDMSGSGKPGWTGDDTNGHNLTIMSAGFTPPNELHRPKEQDQAAPWQTDFPAFKRWTTLIRLPPARPGWRWSYLSAPVDERLGGVAYWRVARLADGIMFTSMSRRAFEPEITQQEAQEIGERLPKFDNNMSQVYEATVESGPDPNPTDPKGEVEAGARLEADQRYDEAAKFYDRALAQRPNLPEALLGKLALRADQGDFAGALQLLDAAQAASPKADFRMLRARILVGAGRNSEALKLLDEVAAATPTNAQLAADTARIEIEAGDSDRAASTVEAGLKASPENYQLLDLRAFLEAKAGRLDLALADAEEAVRQRPESHDALLARGRVLAQMKRYEDALADFDEGWRMNPLENSGIVARADTLDKLGRGAEAMAVYDQWIETDPSAIALNARCWKLALANTDLAKAASDCDAALKLEPSSAAIWDSYALVAFRAGRLDDALTRYDRALALSPRLAPSLYGRGITKIRLGDSAGGNADIAAAQSINAQAGQELNDAGILPPSTAAATH